MEASPPGRHFSPQTLNPGARRRMVYARQSGGEHRDEAPAPSEPAPPAPPDLAPAPSAAKPCSQMARRRQNRRKRQLRLQQMREVYSFGSSKTLHTRRIPPPAPRSVSDPGGLANTKPGGKHPRILALEPRSYARVCRRLPDNPIQARFTVRAGGGVGTQDSGHDPNPRQDSLLASAAKDTGRSVEPAGREPSRLAVSNGWRAHFDPETCKTYYHNRNTNETQWGTPARPQRCQGAHGLPAPCAAHG